MRNLYSSLLFVFIWAISFGQCTIQNTSSFDGYSTAGGQFGQSFTATCSGELEFVELEIMSPGTASGTLYIYNGNMIGGTPIHTQAYTISTDAKVTISGIVPITSGNQYTFNFSNLAPNCAPRYHFNNSYTGGDAYYSNSMLGANTHDWAFEVSIVPPCVQPDIPTITNSSSVCSGSSMNLNIAGNLNGATEWGIYTGSCGGTLIGSTSTSSFSVTPSSPSTTYYVRGNGGCANAGSCASATINVNNLDDASFSYSTNSFCVNGSDPSPTITGLTGGTFASTSGLSIASNGVIDVSASTPGTYTVTYTTNGTCPNSSSQIVTINALDNPSFNYSNATYCLNTIDPIPTITGLTGGTFTGSSGLDINSATGEIDLSTSGAGNYLVTYTTNGACPNNSTESVIVNPLDDASFNFSASSYCANAPDPSPNITGVTGGTFTSTTGLNIIPMSNVVNLDASTPGTYTVTYTTNGTCPNSSNETITINPLDDPSFSYSNSSYCLNTIDPIPNITGTSGGVFTGSSGININSATGEIDLSTSGAGNYLVTYTTNGACPNNSTENVIVNALDDASFNFSASSYCANAPDPSPNITGITGGTFTSTTGLNIIPMSNAINLDASTPGTYIVTYTTNGACPNSSNETITINPMDDPSFSYSNSSYCLNTIDPIPNIAGTPGGVFTGSSGIDINSATGEIDLSTSGAGNYLITYTTNGTCPNALSTGIDITEMDNPGFTYSASEYCADMTNPSAIITGTTGGTFSSTAGLDINSTTGVINLQASTPGSYNVTYTTNGTCSTSSNVGITINAVDDPSFSYTSSEYCFNESDPTPSITGNQGGSFTGSNGLSINSSTGEIDLSTSNSGNHNIQYTTNGTCPASLDVTITISSIDNGTSLSGATITSNETGASYEWIDCDNGNQIISGETGQSFTAINNGNFACIVNNGTCIDTTDCITISTIGLIENNLNLVQISPNPASEFITISSNHNIQTIVIYDLFGSIIQIENQPSFSVAELSNGTYIVSIKTNQGTIRHRLIKR